MRFYGMGQLDPEKVYPPVPMGYNRCAQPSGLTATSEPQATDDPYWMQAIYQDEDGNVYYRYQHLDGEEFWACPAGTQGAGGSKSKRKRNDIKTIQASLKAQGPDYDPGNIDGIPGPKTCGAAYRYQLEVLGLDQPSLGVVFFEGLGLPPDFAQKYHDICEPWYAPEGVIPPDPEPPDPTPPPGPPPGPVGPITPPAPPPAPVAEGFDWTSAMIMALGAASGALLGVATGDKVAPTASRIATGAAGSLVGLLGGFAVNKYARGSEMAGMGQMTSMPPRYRLRWG